MCPSSSLMEKFEKPFTFNNDVDSYAVVHINGIYWFRLQHYFEISLTGNLFAVPTASSAGLTGSDVILRIGLWTTSITSLGQPNQSHEDQGDKNWSSLTSQYVKLWRHTSCSLANSENYIRACKTGWGRGWYRENVSGKRNFKVVLKSKPTYFIHLLLVNVILL